MPTKPSARRARKTATSEATGPKAGAEIRIVSPPGLAAFLETGRYPDDDVQPDPVAPTQPGQPSVPLADQPDLEDRAARARSKLFRATHAEITTRNADRIAGLPLWQRGPLQLAWGIADAHQSGRAAFMTDRLRAEAKARQAARKRALRGTDTAPKKLKAGTPPPFYAVLIDAAVYEKRRAGRALSWEALAAFLVDDVAPALPSPLRDEFRGAGNGETVAARRRDRIVKMSARLRQEHRRTPA